ADDRGRGGRAGANHAVSAALAVPASGAGGAVMRAALSVQIGGIRLKNPGIAAPGEPLTRDAGLAAAITPGAGAVGMKSANESEAARRQLLQAEYAALGSDWRPVAWGPDAPAGVTVLTRSGLHPLGFEAWLDQAVRHDRLARTLDCLLVPSLVLADLDT